MDEMTEVRLEGHVYAALVRLSHGDGEFLGKSPSEIVTSLVERYEAEHLSSRTRGMDVPSAITRSASEMRSAATLLLPGEMSQIGEMAIGAADELGRLAIHMHAAKLHDVLESVSSLCTALEVFSNFSPKFLESKKMSRSPALSTMFFELYVAATELPLEFDDQLSGDVAGSVAHIGTTVCRILKMIHTMLHPEPCADPSVLDMSNSSADVGPPADGAAQDWDSYYDSYQKAPIQVDKDREGLADLAQGFVLWEPAPARSAPCSTNNLPAL